MNNKMNGGFTLWYGKPLKNVLKLPKEYEKFKDLVNNIRAKNESR